MRRRQRSPARPPYRPQSAYWTIVEVLRKLGANRWHDATAVVKAFPAVMGAEKFKAFKAKEKRVEDGLDCSGRIIQNAQVVCRTDRYGVPKEFGFVVSKRRTDAGQQFGVFTLGKATKKSAK